METLETIILGIIELSTFDLIVEGGFSNHVSLKGSQEKSSGLKKIEFIIKKSTNVDCAEVVLIKNDKQYSHEISKIDLYDILNRSCLLDQKLTSKLDILFNDRKLEFKDGKLFIK